MYSLFMLDAFELGSGLQKNTEYFFFFFLKI